MSDQRFEAMAAYPEYVDGKRDFKAWAKRLLFREKNGDKNIMPIQVQFAREALGLDPKKG